MPVARNARRKRSSVHLHLSKSTTRPRPLPTPKNVAFAPNLTPDNYGMTHLHYADESAESTLFGPKSNAPGAPQDEQADGKKKRVRKARKQSEGHIPRPANAFMLFRAEFVRQKHVPGSIEQNHNNLSKIIGSTWKNLPEEERQVWMRRAAAEVEKHKKLYPDYKYQPKHKKRTATPAAPKKSRKGKGAKEPDPDEEERYETLGNLLAKGLTGEALEDAFKSVSPDEDWTSDGDSVHPATRQATPGFFSTAPSPAPSDCMQLNYAYGSAMRRPSSVPLPGIFPFPTAIPNLPFLRQPSIDFGGGGNLSAAWDLPRRPSTAQAFRNWELPFDTGYSHVQPMRPISPLPEVNAELFNPAFLQGNSGFHGEHEGIGMFPQGNVAFTFDGFSSMPMAPNGEPLAPQEMIISPLDSFPPSATQSHWSENMPGSSYSESPSVSERSLPLYAPQPQHPVQPWDEKPQVSTGTSQPVHHVQQSEDKSYAHQLSQFVDFNANYGEDASMASPPVDMTYGAPLESGYPTAYMSTDPSILSYNNVSLDGVSPVYAQTEMAYNGEMSYPPAEFQLPHDAFNAHTQSTYAQ